MSAKLHLAENPLALHLLFQRLEGLVDIVIPNENLHEASSYGLRWGWGSAAAISPRLLPNYEAFSRIIIWSPTIVSGRRGNLRRYSPITLAFPLRHDLARHRVDGRRPGGLPRNDKHILTLCHE